MLTDHISFLLHTDIYWEKVYKSDKDYLNKEKFKYTLTFKNKDYVLFKKHVMLSDLLISSLLPDTNDKNLILNLKYCQDEASFDLFMQMLYGKTPLQVPLNSAPDIITICFELGTKPSNIHNRYI